MNDLHHGPSIRPISLREDRAVRAAISARKERRDLRMIYVTGLALCFAFAASLSYAFG